MEPLAIFVVAFVLSWALTNAVSNKPCPHCQRRPNEPVAPTPRTEPEPVVVEMPVEPPRPAEELPRLAMFTWQGEKIYCAKCRSVAEIRTEMGAKLVTCQWCGSSVPVNEML